MRRRKNYGIGPLVVPLGIIALVVAVIGTWKITDSLTQETAGLPMWAWVAIIIVVIMVLFRKNESSQGNIIIYDDD